MNQRYFWLIPEFVKFRVTFETAETVVGVTDENERRLFRKDTEKICFNEREALRLSIAKLIEGETEVFLSGKTRAVCV